MELTQDPISRKIEDILGTERLAFEFDEYYTRFLLGSVSSFVARTLKFTPLIVRELPSPSALQCMAEATRNRASGTVVEVERPAVEERHRL